MKYLLLAVVCLCGSAGIAQAQTPPIVGLTVTVQNAAGVAVGTPQSATWPLPAGSCNLTPTPVPAGTLINPANLELDDPALPGRACRINFAVYFATFPAASGYRATAKFTYSDGTSSGASNVTNPFDELPVRPAPTGVGVR